MIEVRLSWLELFQAATVGVVRQIEALKKGRPDRYGYKGDGWSIHINGACAELAAAKVTDRYWHALAERPKDLPGDVGTFQVRHSTNERYRLIVHPSDPDDAIFCLVLGEPPLLRVMGVISGEQAKQERWWDDPTGQNRPAFFVPQDELLPLEGRR